MKVGRSEVWVRALLPEMTVEPNRKKKTPPVSWPTHSMENRGLYVYYSSPDFFL